MIASATTDPTLERRIRQLLLLQETAKKVNSILDLEQLLDEIVGGVAEAFGCNRTAVLLKDDITNELEMIALRGFSNVHLKGYRFKVGGEGMVGHVSATAKMHYAPDVRSDPYYVVSEPTTLSEVDIPLISRGKLIGIFNAQSPSLDAFSSEQIELLCALADTIAIAIENARLFRQERLAKEKALREQTEARQIQRALLPEADPTIAGYTVSGMCLQLSAVGGDWYDYLHIGGNVWGHCSWRRVRQGDGGCVADVRYPQSVPHGSGRVEFSIRSPHSPQQITRERPSIGTVRDVALSYSRCRACNSKTSQCWTPSSIVFERSVWDC